MQRIEIRNGSVLKFSDNNTIFELPFSAENNTLITVINNSKTALVLHIPLAPKILIAPGHQCRFLFREHDFMKGIFLWRAVLDEQR